MSRAAGTEANCPKILIASHDIELQTLANLRLGRCGYSVDSCTNVAALAQYVGEQEDSSDRDSYELLVCDVSLLNGWAVHLLEYLQQQQILPPLVLMQGSTNRIPVPAAARLQTVAIFDDKFDFPANVARIRQLVPIYSSREPP